MDIKFSVLFRSGNVGLWELVTLGGGGRPFGGCGAGNGSGGLLIQPADR